MGRVLLSHTIEMNVLSWHVDGVVAAAGDIIGLRCSARRPSLFDMSRTLSAPRRRIDMHIPTRPIIERGLVLPGSKGSTAPQ
jgi:hypothetical protein